MYVFLFYIPKQPLKPSFKDSTSPSKPRQISESFRRFGITPLTTSLLALKVVVPDSTLSASSIQTHLSAAIQGEQVPFSDASFAQMTDLNRLRKLYKLNSGAGSGGGGKKGGRNVKGIEKEVEDRKELEVLCLGCMALRGAVN